MPVYTIILKYEVMLRLLLKLLIWLLCDYQVLLNISTSAGLL